MRLQQAAVCVDGLYIFNMEICMYLYIGYVRILMYLIISFCTHIWMFLSGRVTVYAVRLESSNKQTGNMTNLFSRQRVVPGKDTSKPSDGMNDSHGILQKLMWDLPQNSDRLVETSFWNFQTLDV